MHAALFGQLAGLAVVFGVSGFGKARALRAFAASLRGWRVVPDRLVAPVAVTGLEIAVVAGALVSLATTATGAAWRPVAVATLVVAAFLLTVLTVGIALALRHGPGWHHAPASARPSGRSMPATSCAMSCCCWPASAASPWPPAPTTVRPGWRARSLALPPVGWPVRWWSGSTT